MEKEQTLGLNAFVALATHRSFRAAAAELSLSPSALSHAIAVLEKRVGVRLFHRTTRSVSLSEAGAQFLARVRPALREISLAMEAINDFRETPRGTLRINASRGAAHMVLLPVVLEFLARHPEMHVDLVTEERLVDIVDEGFDAGVRIAYLVPQDMVSIPCGPRVRWAIVGAKSYFRRHPAPKVPGDLLAHNCIRFRTPSGAIYRWELEKRGKEVTIEVKGALTVTDDQLARRAALKGAGLAYLTEWAVSEDLAAGRLVRVLEDWTPEDAGLRLYYPGHRHVPAALKAFIAVLRELHKSSG
jgi:DNA-binding transcriptional LysR family regulator